MIDDTLTGWFWLVWHFLLLLPLQNRESEGFSENPREREIVRERVRFVFEILE